ncbi:hypothetical protein PUN28_018607 [Cardiocondyla obscurior]|uniref:Uncharacterized protein n=1 Tax=Cardiocondyla obscurior TaxID=286306 RepID=A0AAW2EFM7_9HYME
MRLCILLRAHDIYSYSCINMTYGSNDTTHIYTHTNTYTQLLLRKQEKKRKKKIIKKCTNGE